ncbi:hypothetical protein NQ176_g4359 [Zarea fungicola]|uniref:Uncharacterized protein n=1 Tax=Zarea fungicola TaxID=93591 RepID=A0ACC1NDQ5_9HYPO|nr:hypothetical protein NQ176_g4359 [Lecanicillium fungicola]
MSTWEQTLSPRGPSYPEFNYEFLIFLVIAGLLSIFFLLYFNRLFGSIVSYAIRTWTWHQYKVYIDIQALQISLLAGRVFFSGLRYHGVNETFLIQHGYVTWQYWLRRVREADVLDDKSPDKDNNSKLPCRINVNLVGLEWFVYNRTPAYEGVLAGLKQADATRSSSNDAYNEKTNATEMPRKRNTRGLDQLEEIFPPSRNGPPAHARQESSNANSFNAESMDELASIVQEPPFMIQWLPVHIECRTAAAVIGNENTKAILVVKANGLTCEVDASAAKKPDSYRQLFDIEFNHPIIEMKENDDFKEDQPTRATKEREIGIHFDSQPKRAWFRHRRRKFVSSLRNIVPYWRRSVESFSGDSRADLGTAASHVPASHRWQGLSRYLDDRDQDDKARWSSVEYAAVTTILDAPSAHLRVYWDVVGKVWQTDARPGTADSLLHVNGGEAPAWGMHFIIRGGTINYGPWADRQRADLQRVFMPGLSKDANPAKQLTPGDWRVATGFQLLIELEDTVTLRIPIREESKNWRWRGKEPPINQQGPMKRRQRNKAKKKSKTDVNQTRPVGWLEFKVPVNSSMEYSMDMVARSTGYKNMLRIDLPTSELWSSVNHDILWRSGPQKIACDLSNPLGWNTLRNWHFNITSDDMRIYLLREHIFLLIDLVNDWASGAPSEYLVFTPYNYHLNLKLRNLQAFLNINDGNVIDNATSPDENNFLILSAPTVHTATTILLDKYLPEKNSIPFDIRAESLRFSVRTPQWNTESAFLDSSQLGNAEGLVVSGSYQYNASTSTANTDSLILNVHAQSPHVFLYGYLVRYLMLLKDNYFGEHVHFRTVEEFREQMQVQIHGETEAQMQGPLKKSNDLDVILSVKVDDPQISLPTNLYSANRYIRGELASVAVDLRFTNYYMDLELDLSPLSLSLGTGSHADSPSLSTSNTQLFIDGIRVFGHRAFGLPPSEPTYFCNWDVLVGAVRGGCSAEFLSALIKGGSAFGFTFDDVENALVPYSSLIFYDVTFIRARLEAVSLWIHVPDAAFLISTGTIDVNSNDWARSHYSKRANVVVPNIQISCVDAESAAEHKSRHQHPVETEAYLQMDVRLGSIGRKVKFSNERKIQQELIRREDQRTDRTPFLIYDDLLDRLIPEHVAAPAQCTPPPPYPVDDADADHPATSIRSGASRQLRRQSSFLSFASSGSSSSVRRKKTVSSSHHSHSQPQNSTKGILLLPPNYETRGKLEESLRNNSRSHPAVTFSSPYFAPHFSMEGIQPDMRQLGSLDAEGAKWDDPFENPSASLSNIDPRTVGEEYAYSSAIIEVPSGVTAFVKPKAVIHLISVLEILQPTTPEDILDDLQVDSMKDIFGAKKRIKASGDITDMLIRLPGVHIRFLSTSVLDSHDCTSEETDQYDLHLSNVSLVTRNVLDRLDGSVLNNKSKTSLQLRMSGAELSATERLASAMKTQAAVMVQIDQILVSLGSKDVTYLDADIGSIVGSTASGNIEYLAALIHRTGNIASELLQLLADTSSRQKNRVKYCCIRLVDLGQSTNDPPFLIRPSAVLRTVDQHLRTVDSWKLAMRLRQIWTLLPETDRVHLTQACSTGAEHLPHNAAEMVVDAFQQWRSWDLEDPRQTVLLKRVFGSMDPAVEQKAEEPPFLSACRLGELQFILDPGPKQNRVAITELTSRFERKSDASLGEQLGIDDLEDLLNTADVSCSHIHADLNWELLELAQIILKLYTRNQPEAPTPCKKPKPARMAKATNRMALHVFFEIGKGSLNFETVNLRSSNVLKDFKASTLLYKADDGRAFHSLMLNCAEATSRMHSQSSLLWASQLLYPSVTVSQEVPEVKPQPINLVKGAASCRGLSFGMEKDIVGLLEIVDAVIQDEGSQLAQLQKQFPKSEKKATPSDISHQLSSLKINIVLFLDGYSISVPLLQSLSYKVSGVVARAACAADPGKELVFDLDVKDNSHDIQMNVNNKLQSISVLQMPPTNGRVTTQTRDSVRIVNIQSSIEVIRLDASAIYSLLAAANRPQISAEIQDIQDQVKSIQEHLSELFGPKQSLPAMVAPPRTTTLPIMYDVHLTLAGFQALTKTTLNNPKEPFAQLLFALDKFHVEATNRDMKTGAIMKYPELSLNLRNIGFNVRRGHEWDTRSCGNLGASVTVNAGSRRAADGKMEWIFNFMSDDLHVILSPETVSTVIDILGHMSSRIKDLDTSRELEYLRKLRQSKPRISINDDEAVQSDGEDLLDSVLSSVSYRFQLRNIRASWDVAKESDHNSDDKEDLHFSISLIEFCTRTKKSAQLTIEDLQLQMVPPGHDRGTRSLHSALLPEVIFNVAYISTADARRLAFQAKGKSLDLRLTSAFILPAANLVQSISLSAKNVQEASAQWTTDSTSTVQDMANKEPTGSPTIKQRSIFGNKRLESLLLHADFAGAVVHVSSSDKEQNHIGTSLGGRYGQFNVDDSGNSAVLRSPGLALKGEYRDDDKKDPTLFGEIKIDASENILYPAVVPLILDIVSNIKEVVSEEDKDGRQEELVAPKLKSQKTGEEDNILTADPRTVIGRLKLNLGLRICRQQFTLSCQPIARVAATTSFEHFYLTCNTITSQDHGEFFAISGILTKPLASVQHVYSRESTASFALDSVTLSLMNSKHVSGVSGVSAIINVSPMKISVNARQAPDFLLFREIWYPEELHHADSAPVAKLQTETSQVHLVQRYQQVAATAAFPWTATVSIAALNVSVDLGQAIGKSVFQIQEFWVSSKKSSDWEQNLCLGFNKIGIDCTGRLSGFIALQHFQLRTSIQWPKREEALNETPLVQASLAFKALQIKAAFDYQAFLVGDVTSLGFLMYNVRESREGTGDRLVAIFDGDAIQLFGTTSSAAQAVATYQALKKLMQENSESFEASLKDMEKSINRKSVSGRGSLPSRRTIPEFPESDTLSKSPISLDTDVVVTLRALNLGVFPSTFSDHQVFKVEALDAYARFAASMEQRKIHSLLRMTLGQLRVGLAGVRNVEAPRTLSEMRVEDVVERSTGSRECLRG